MTTRLLSLSLLLAAALPACQTDTPMRADQRSIHVETSTPKESTTDSSTSGFSTRRAEASASDDADLRVPASATWAAGTKHLSVGGSFTNDKVESAPNVDIETLELNAVFGVLLSEHIETNVQAVYHEVEAGTDDINRTGLLVGLRYHLIVPTAEQGLGIYAEGKAGVVTVDRSSGDSTDFAYGASTGVLWFPWGLASGVAIDLALNFLEADELERVGASLALGYYW